VSTQNLNEIQKKLNFHERLSPEYIMLDLKSDTKEEIIKELAQCIENHKNLLNLQNFLRDVFKREADTSTGVGDGIAIPHARTDAVDDIVVAVGRTKTGCDFKSQDGKPVEVLILMGTPIEKVSLYLKLLAHLSYLLKKPGFIDGLKSAAMPEDIIDLFARNEVS